MTITARRSESEVQELSRTVQEAFQRMVIPFSGEKFQGLYLMQPLGPLPYLHSKTFSRILKTFPEKIPAELSGSIIYELPESISFRAQIAINPDHPDHYLAVMFSTSNHQIELAIRDLPTNRPSILGEKGLVALADCQGFRATFETNDRDYTLTHSYISWRPI